MHFEGHIYPPTLRSFLLSPPFLLLLLLHFFFSSYESLVMAEDSLGKNSEIIPRGCNSIPSFFLFCVDVFAMLNPLLASFTVVAVCCYHTLLLLWHYYYVWFALLWPSRCCLCGRDCRCWRVGCHSRGGGGGGGAGGGAAVRYYFLPLWCVVLGSLVTCLLDGYS